MPQEFPVILYDGVCGLCDRAVQFVLKHDRSKHFRFATLQSAYARHLLGGKPEMDTFVLVYRGKCYERSTGALFTLWYLGGYWRLTAVLLIIPGFIRDAVYNRISKNRYAWFGKRASCRLPLPDDRFRFIDLNEFDPKSSANDEFLP